MHLFVRIPSFYRNGSENFRYHVQMHLVIICSIVVVFSIYLFSIQRICMHVSYASSR